MLHYIMSRRMLNSVGTAGCHNPNIHSGWQFSEADDHDKVDATPPGPVGVLKRGNSFVEQAILILDTVIKRKGQGKPAQ